MKARAKALLDRAIDKLQATFPVNRVVVILTPLVFVPVAGSVTAWVAKNLPGLSGLGSGELTALFAAGGLAAFAAAYKWIDGWQQGERSLDELYNQRELVKAQRTAPAGRGSVGRAE